MILETAQILSTNCHLANLTDAPYKKTHQNHPCTVWARQSYANTNWLIDHFNALSGEYTHRFNKIHKSSQYLQYFIDSSKKLALEGFYPNQGMSEFASCVADDLKTLQLSVTEKYRAYMKMKWVADQSSKRHAKWTNTNQPNWL
jgi:hypothetical protein